MAAAAAFPNTTGCRASAGTLDLGFAGNRGLPHQERSAAPAFLGSLQQSPPCATSRIALRCGAVQAHAVQLHLHRLLSASTGGFRTLNVRMRMRELTHRTQSIRARIAERISRVSFHKRYIVPLKYPMFEPLNSICVLTLAAAALALTSCGGGIVAVSVGDSNAVAPDGGAVVGAFGRVAQPAAARALTQQPSLELCSPTLGRSPNGHCRRKPTRRGARDLPAGTASS